MSSARRRRWFWPALAIVLVSLGSALYEWRAIQSLLREEVPAKLFPQAVEVRLFAHGLYASRPFEQELVPAGVPLSQDEIAALRRAVVWVKPPDAIAGCCIPRHQFRFYDAQHHQLGQLEVCFECLCAHIVGEAPPRPDLDWVDWDVSSVDAIITAHNLPTDVVDDRQK